MYSQKRGNVQTTIVALLVARKGGCTLSQLSKDYYETEGENIPWKELGYLSLLNFLQSMPGSVEVEIRNSTILVRGIASSKSKHISKLVAGQKDAQRLYAPRRSFRQSHYYPNTGPQRVHIPAEILSTVISYINDHPDGVNKDYLLQKVQSHMPHINISMSDMEEQLNKLYHQIYQSHNKFFPVQRKPRNFNLDTVVVTASGEEDSDDLLDCEDDDDGFGFVSSEYKSHPLEARSIAKIKPTSSFIQDSLSKCQDQSAENQVLEHTSNLQTNSFPSNSYNYNENIQSHIEYNNNTEQENYFDGNNVDILINERVKFRLEKLIQSHPDGIWCADLPEKYLLEYKITLNYNELGFNSVREFASQLPEIFHCVQPNDTGDFMLYYAKSEIPLNKQKEKQKSVNLAELHNIYDKDEEPEALPTTLSLDTCKKLIPDGIVTIGECVGQINVEDLVDIEKPYVEVIVVEVFTPSFFWIQLRKKQKAFKTFMDDLHEFYTEGYTKYTIPPVVLEKGLNCACVYNGAWHRGIIKTVKPDFQVTVMFYDYGTLKTYPPNAVFYLHRMFSSLPAQAIPCGLINTKPYKGSKWSRSATHEFALKTSQFPLIATVASINTEDNSMMVTLTDTSEEEDLHINDWLVEQKLAQHGKMGDKVDMSNLLIYVEENLIYAPHHCYEDETKEPENSVKNSESVSINAPLVSPQSTLSDKTFNFPPGLPLLDESSKLSTITEESLENQMIKNDPQSATFPSLKTNTNPFLQNEFIWGQTEDELTPEKFVQLWYENLKLQMQITTTFQILFDKITKKWGKNVDGSTMKYENILKMMNTILQTNKASPTNSNTGTVNIPNTNDFMNIQCSNGNSVLPTLNEQQTLHSPADNTNFNSNNYDDPFRNIDIQNSFKHLTSAYPNYFTPDDKNDCYSSFESFNTQFNKDRPKSPEKSMGASFKETNPFRLSLAGKLQIDSDGEKSCLNSNLVSAAQSNQGSGSEHNPTNYQKDTNYGISKGSFHEFTFNYNQSGFPNGSNNIKNNLSALNAQASQSANYTWNLENVANNMSKIVIDNPCVAHGISKTNDMEQRTEKNNEKVLNLQKMNYLPFSNSPQAHIEKQNQKENLISDSCFLQPTASFVDHNYQAAIKRSEQTTTYTNDISNFNQAQSPYFPASEGTFSCKSGNENYASSSMWLPINSPLSYGLDNTNIDEGYLTRPSTSNTSYRSSPLVQMNSEVEYNQHSSVKNSNELRNMPTRMWIESIEELSSVQCENWNKMNSLSNETECIKKNPNDNYQQERMNTTGTRDTEKLYIGTKVLNSSKAENEIRDVWKSHMFKNAGCMEKKSLVVNYTLVYNTIYFLPVELPKQTVHVFHYQREGWLLIDEFIKAFTDFEGSMPMMDFLHLLNIQFKVPFQEINKEHYLIRPLTFDGCLLEQTRFIMYNSTNLQLMPLKLTLKLLNKFKIISRKDIDDAIQKEFVDGSVMHSAWLIIFSYGQFKYYLENCQPV